MDKYVKNRTVLEGSNNSPAGFRALFLFLLFAVLLIGLDQWTKQLAVANLKGQPNLALIPDVLYLSYVENFGAAFGMMQGMRPVFFAITLAVAAGILYTVLRLPRGRRHLPLGLVCLLVFSGAIGNLIDRVWHSYVVDFIYFSPINFPVFNVADIYVTVGCALMLILFVFYYKDEDFAFLGRKRSDV